MLFETNLDEKRTQRCSIGICGLAGCYVPRDIVNLFGRLKALCSAQKVIAVQLFNSDTIATHLHILVSALYALRAFGASKNISNTMETEILLYASAQHQIVDAIERIGVKPGSLNVAVVAISLRQEVMDQTMAAIMKELAGQVDDSVLSINTPDKASTIKAIFGITEKELDSARMGMDPKDVEWAITRRVLSKISIMAISK